MLRLKVFLAVFVLSLVRVNTTPLEGDYSSLNRENLLPKELLNEFQTKLDNQNTEVIPGLVEGGKYIAMTDNFYKSYRLGIGSGTIEERKWINRTIPYLISPLYDASDLTTINSALRIINKLSCLKFIPKNDSHKDFLLIWPVKLPYGCWSFVGRNGGMQILSLSTADGNGNNCLNNEGKALHEFMHAAGVFHEQSRADRDNYVDILYDNIIPEYKSNFDKQAVGATALKYEYDYNSIMHYGYNYFAKDLSKPTIWPKSPQGKNIGQRIGLSQSDCLKLNELYGCLDNKKTAKKYLARCQVLGLSK